MDAAVSLKTGRRGSATFATYVENSIHYRSLTEEKRRRHPIFDETKNPLSGGVHSFIGLPTPTKGTLNRNAIETGFEIALASQADNLVGDLAFIEEQQRGNRANTVFGGQCLLFVDI